MAALINVFATVCWILLIPFIATSDPRIINGTAAIAENTRHQVSIRIKDIDSIFSTGHVCGGSLIKPKVVLSAAYCIYDDDSEGYFNASIYFVVMGSLNRFEKTENTISLDVKHIEVADFNRQTFKNDIALLFLDGEVPDSNPAISVIPMNREVIPVGTVCQVTGWGDTELGSVADVLMTLDVPIMDNETCSINYGEGVIMEGMICAGYMEGGKSTCQGDSGGPLVSQGKLVGIVSFEDACGQPGFPGVYTDVSYHINWIEETIKKNSASLKFLSNSAILFGMILFACLK